MKNNALIILFLLVCGNSFSQHNCSCETDSLLFYGINCDTITLKNNAKLYYLFDCDSAGLVFENGATKKQLFSMDTTLQEYADRLKFSLLEEYEHALLFEWGCSAMGSCGHQLVNKENGEFIQEFGEIIQFEDGVGENFIAYFTNPAHSELTVLFVDSDKKISAQVSKNHMAEITPEQQFVEYYFLDGYLVLKYEYETANELKYGTVKFKL